MNKIIFFDLDQTIYDHDTNQIPSETKKLLETLHQMPNVKLGIASGRSYQKLNIIKSILYMFDYFVLINGGIVYQKQHMLFDYPISIPDISNIQKEAFKHRVNVGMVGAHQEALSYKDPRASYEHVGLQFFNPIVDEKLYLKTKIYQLWLIGDTLEDIESFAAKYPSFKLYLWRRGGSDFLYEHVNKAKSIKRLLESEKEYQLICIGDGFNDIQMIEMADIGIAMGNARTDELIKKADLVAPHIRDNQLFDFFKKEKLI